MSATNDAKRALRRTMRMVRRAAAADPSRSAAIVERLSAMAELERARTVMVFEAVPGEPDLSELARRCRRRGVDVVTPTPEVNARPPIAPDLVDAVLVPGLAFTPSGLRLGQGGGWYDRFLAGVRPDCVTIGVCFDEQIVDTLPAASHDVAVWWVVTPSGTIEVATARR